MTAVIGRGLEIAEAEQVLDAAATGVSACAVWGQPGIGKTALWQAVLRIASDRGFQTLEARPVEAETAVSFAALGDLLANIDAPMLAALPPPQRRALEVATLRAEPTRPIDDIRAIGTAMASLIGALSARGPLVIAIDDVQWLDGPTGDALAFALRRSLHCRAAVVVTCLDAAQVDPLLGSDRAGAGRTTRIRLGPLDPASLGSVVQDRLDVTLPQRQAARLHEITGGNPYFALELARSAWDTERHDLAWDDVAVGTDLVRLTQARIAALPPRTRLTLAAASALRDPTPAALEQAMDATGTVTLALRLGRRAGVVRVIDGVVRFEHPLLAAAAYGSVPAADRAALHRRLADVVTDPEARARQLMLGVQTPDDAVATALEEGARRAAQRGAFQAAAELAGRAASLTPASSIDARRDRLLMAADDLMRSGELAQSRAVYEQLLADAPPGPARAELLRSLAEIRINEDSFTDAMALLEEAASEAAGATMLSASIELALAYGAVQTLDPRGSRRHARRALEQALGLGVPPLLGVALAVDQISSFIAGEGVSMVACEEALATEAMGTGGPAVLRPSLIVGLVVFWMGQHVRARELLRTVARQAADVGDEPGLVFVLMAQSWIELTCGGVQEAARLADECLEVAERLGTSTLMAQALIARARVAAAVGDVGAFVDADRAVELTEHSGWRSGFVWPRGIAGSFAWSRGDAELAVDTLHLVYRLMDEAGYADPGVLPYLGDLIEALLALGRRAEAESLVVMAEERGRALERPWALLIASRARALMHAADGHLIDAIRATDDAIAQLSLLDPWPYEEARTLLVRGRIERRAKRRAAARSSLVRARELFDRLQAAPWLAQVDQELARLGSPGHANALTETEARVATLAATGLTNREVAQRVFVTPKSVEGILARVYAKLGIRSRAELGAWAASKGGPGG